MGQLAHGLGLCLLVQAHSVGLDNRNWRYAELTVVKANPSLLVAVLEDHTKPGSANVVNKLVAIDTTSQSVTTVAEGADFYSSPFISPNGKKISWIQW